MKFNSATASLVLILCWPACVFAMAQADLGLTIAAAKSTPVYHLGERIVLRLTFWTSSPGSYQIRKNTWPRVYGGLGPEQFIASSGQSAVDPYVDVTRELGDPLRDRF